jgi:hypothetical protein
VANVSNFVPKPHTPYQWQAMQRREYFAAAHQFLRRRCRMRSVEIKCHAIESSLVEGMLTRGDWRVGHAIELAWQKGARFDGWTDHFNPQIWWETFQELGLSPEVYIHRPWDTEALLPWDHIAIRQGRSYLEREHQRSATQLVQLAGTQA